MEKERLRQQFAARLSEALNEAGIDSPRRASTLAKWVGKNTKNPEFARKWLTAQSMPQKNNLTMVANKLGVRAEWLEYGTGSRHETPDLTKDQKELLGAYIGATDEIKAAVHRLLETKS